MKFIKDTDILILNYSSDSPLKWLMDKFKNNEGYTFSNTFHLTKNDLIEDFNVNFLNENQEEESLDFQFGVLDEEGIYYKIQKSILDIKNDLYIHKQVKLERKMFVAEYKISIFKHIDNLINEPIYLGGRNRNAISYEDFQKLLNEFPNTTERAKYCQQRLSAILTPYFESRLDVKEKYEKYMNKKQSVQGKKLLSEFRNYEKDKYKAILRKLEEMLKREEQYNEIQWQKEIIEILRLIFPKYIQVLEKVQIKDCHTGKNRELDCLLIDSEGYIDILEIKRPLGYQIISKKPDYRDNHCPVKELSGTVMQVEKYILHLNKWGKIGENDLNKKHKKKLPFNLKIKITNPGAMIILGRSNNLNMEQNQDFEIIKRKYKNVIDIITYDDLIKRLKFTISQYEKEQ